MDEAIEELGRRGWITRRKSYSLTSAGEAAHAALAQKVDWARRQIRLG
ncbi:hypothetical protein [Actinomadura nitritigenes]|uniref:HTH hxlR-type domain-containing protein n=1 Tax=Actinomadura nitritigenes TaxID=134602 RepID=A0ABS3RD16_9ACTN|nr:hypothetical protein [Actinomadura nitritigenes]